MHILNKTFFVITQVKSLILQVTKMMTRAGYSNKTRIKHGFLQINTTP